MTARALMACRSRDGSVAITVAVLEECLDRAALLIAESGNKGVVYLPIYDRLEVELETLKAREDRMAHIRARVRR